MGRPLREDGREHAGGLSLLALLALRASSPCSLPFRWRARSARPWSPRRSCGRVRRRQGRSQRRSRRGSVRAGQDATPGARHARGYWLRCSAQSLGSNAWRRRSRAGAGPPAWERRAKSCARAIKLDPADAAARFCSSPLRLLSTTSLSECCIFRCSGIPVGWSPFFFA